MIRYSRYGGEYRSITHEELLAFQEETGMLFARAEDSGSEGCYVEVASWNDRAGQWQRFCFAKFFGGELVYGPYETADAKGTARVLAEEINRRDSLSEYVSIVHRMPDFNQQENP